MERGTMELIRFAFRLIVRLVALHIAVYSAAIFGPVLFIVPFVLIAKYPTADFTWLAVALFWVAPLSAGFYTNFYWHWTAVREWQREGGKPGQWNEDNGGIVRTGLRSIVIMFSAWLASYVFEVLFVLAFSRVPLLSGTTRKVVGFALMPFATYAPVLLLWLHRWMRGLRQATAH
jgi:hypothetical protein